MNNIQIIGLGQDFLDIFPSYREIIHNADVLVGGRRQLQPFKDITCEKIIITPPIKQIIQYISKLKDKKIVILADGDPLFFGIGERVVKEFGEDSVEIFPNISVAQRAASKLKVSLRELDIISLHGRGDIFKLLSAISWNDYVGVYTDRFFSPNKIASELLKREIFDFKIHVFERLGTQQEKYRDLFVQDACTYKFADPNFVILERIRSREFLPHLGMEDEIFIKHNNQITKKEVRILSICQMKLKQDSCIWDIGSGSGSISIESLVIAKRGKVFAIEKDLHKAEIIFKNKNRFGVYAIEIINDMAEKIIQDLPTPDRIFIGGGLSNQNNLLEMAYNRLERGGRIVVNTVLMETFLSCIEFCRKKSIYYSVMQVHVDRSEFLGKSMRLVPINPVMIITLIKEK